MVRRAVFVAVVLPFLTAPGAELVAQDQDDVERATFGIDFGALSPLTTFNDEFGENSFESGFSLGVSGTGWFHESFGVRFKVVRSETDATNSQFEYAALAVQDPTQWSFSGELTGRREMELGGSTVRPYAGIGVGMRHYTWDAARHNEDKFFMMTASGGADIRPESLGPFGVTLEIRAYRSKFNQFGINEGNWRPGTPARPVDPDIGTDIGFYGGETDHVWSNDLLFTVGASYSF